MTKKWRTLRKLLKNSLKRFFRGLLLCHKGIFFMTKKMENIKKFIEELFENIL